MGQAVIGGRPERPQLALGAYEKQLQHLVEKIVVSPVELAMEIGQSLFIALYRKRSFHPAGEKDREYFFTAVFNDQIIRQCTPPDLFIQVFTPDYMQKDVLALRSCREKNTLFVLLPEVPADYRDKYFKALQIRTYLHSRDPRNIPDYVRTYPAKLQEARKYLTAGDRSLKKALTGAHFFALGKEMVPTKKDAAGCLDEGMQWFVGMKK